MVHFICSPRSEKAPARSQPLQSSTGTKCLTAIPFDAVSAACRLCVRDAATCVCIITNCCKGKSMKVKWRHPAAVGHTLKGDKHTLCCHIFKENWMSTLLQQQPFFTLNRGRSPSPTKGKELSPVLHTLLKRRKDHSSEAYSHSLCHAGLKLQMLTCGTWAVPFPF